MYVAMVQQSDPNKFYWFELPEEILAKAKLGSRVACNTALGVRYGTIIGIGNDDNDAFRRFMVCNGAVIPLRKIIGVLQNVPLTHIFVPKYMVGTEPKDEKLARRFLEFYHTGDFKTRIVIAEDGELQDGYSAYLVAQKLKLTSLNVIVQGG